MPIVQDLRNETVDSLPGFVAIRVLHQKLVIVGMNMADMGDHSQTDGLRVEFFGRCGTADASTILAAGMFGDLIRFFRRAPGKVLADGSGKCGQKFVIKKFPSFGGSRLSLRADFRIR